MRRLILLLFLVAAAWAAYVVLAPAGSNRETFVEILPGTPTMQIAAQLKEHGVIHSKYAFEAERLIKGGTLKAGEYRFDHPAPISEVYERLERGDVYTVAVTIPEGSNLFDIAERIESANLGTREKLLDTARTNVSLIADLDPAATSLEGYLFPDTYHFERHATATQILAAMVKRFRQEASAIGMKGDYHHVVTVASLVERETPIDDERPLVASVFENRLAKNMPLETDPSVIYAALLEGRYRGAIYASDLQADSLYNTYRFVGLPPGPICSPGAASLKAAMHPAHTGYLYFVAATANPSGKSRFSNTLEEHTRNVEQYRKARRAAGTR